MHAMRAREIRSVADELGQAYTVPPQPTHQKIYVGTQDVIPTAPGRAPPKLEAGSNKQQKLLNPC